MADVLVVWDFDWSLVNQNSDTYILQEMDPSGALLGAVQKYRRQGQPWTELVDWAVGELQSRHSYTVDDMRNTLAKIPVMRGALDAVSLARNCGAEQRILSDANSFYISSILEAQGLQAAFALIETNPAETSNGRLRVMPHHPAHEAPHECPNCPPNLCKGRVLERWLRERPNSRCVYVGDGGGDFCPALRLRRGDALMVRQYPHDGLLLRIRSGAKSIVAHVREWGGAADVDGLALADGFRCYFSTPSSPVAG
mmetsp:Transcript_16212/g.27003  ORF Transcript_16212/g.27003 Transcript_16212/m.27003 type:complete len:254 (-) Transcript_16212:157-918(-)|eukprot:CAMPEP_0119304190 /NCGR_PEP_ID=MMETSP1333-20130426/5484_1 /TAXON_ID=418940 /ORGANISM="Scyphosphaera apsteinii, Strain RCC1455" /LENGTH=253 /DNA_ID=CAMNT_0007307039 /DNA_START=37 /DNA_END=798 /DNA_ORIENTATION=-